MLQMEKFSMPARLSAPLHSFQKPPITASPSSFLPSLKRRTKGFRFMICLSFAIFSVTDRIYRARAFVKTAFEIRRVPVGKIKLE